jgi:hypothetical protein
MRSRGTFDVKLAPLPAYDQSEESLLGRMSIDKIFRGDLDATSVGEMLTALTPEKGSAAYVAIERVSGTLHGRPGSFVLQHAGLMDRGAQELTISVVPDSGTGELTGLRGTMRIAIVEGVHSYELEYLLPAVG